MIIKKILYGIINNNYNKINKTSILLSRYLHKYAIYKELKRIPNPVIYDIGAFDGSWTRSMNRIVPSAYFYKFDPNIRNNSFENNESHKVLLFSSIGEVQFHSNLSTGDSIYKEVGKKYNDDMIITRDTETLDSYVKNNGLNSPHLIKIDTQGSEIEILKGALDTLKKNCFLVYMEVPVLEYNEGAPNTTAIISFMKEIGFSPSQIFEQHIHDGILYQVDILFKRAC